MTIPALWHAEWTAPLVNHLWQSTAVVAAAWLLALALRRNHASARYWVWMAASLKFLVPFWLLIGAGEWARSLLSAPPSPPPALAAAMGQIAQPFSQIPQEQFFGAAVPSAAAPRADLLPAILLAIWACGTLVVLFRWMRGWLRVRAAVQAASPLKIAADIPALSSTAPIEPGIFGIFRPVLLLPAGILNHLTPAQLNAIVAHEMCHVRRRDNLTFALHMIVEALFWFHPAVWWIGARLIEERERACDEAVVQAGGQAEIYAEGILNICKFYVESPLGCVAGITGADLKKRVVRIMSEQVGRRLSRGRKLTLAVAGLAAIFGLLLVGMIDAPLSFAGQSTTALHAQDIAGQWQGTLKAQQDQRVILVIAKENGALKGTMYSYSVDAHAALPNKVSSISLDGSSFKFASNLVGATYEGKLSADGNTITGTLTDYRSTTRPLVLVRANKTTAWEIPAPPPPPKVMPADADPSVEVATIKPNDSGAIRMQSIGFDGHNFNARAASLEDLITYAYQVQARQIVGGPSWMSSERYDVVAVPDVEGEPNSEQERSIVRKLLADRLQLKFHKETRKMSAYVLTVDKGGAKIAHTQLNGPLAGFRMRPVTGGLMLMLNNVNMPIFAYALERSSLLDRPVVDHTGLQGRFDFTLTFLPDETQFDGHSPIGKLADGVEPAPSLFEAMRQQLGLKLSSEKTAVDVLAIDHVEKPSPN